MQVDKDYSVPQVSPELVTRGQKDSANIHFSSIKAWKNWKLKICKI